MEQKPKPPKPRHADSTLMFKTEDPGAETLILPKSGRLATLRERLSHYSVAGSVDPAVFNFEVFREHMAGINPLRIEGVSFDVILTSGRSLFLLSLFEAEELSARFARLNKSLFENSTTLVSPEFPPVHLYRISSKDLAALETICGSTIENLRKKLAGAAIESAAEGFDLAAFLKETTEASGFYDLHDNFIIAMAGGDSAVFSLYVNPGTPPMHGLEVCRFTCDGDRYVLLRSELIY